MQAQQRPPNPWYREPWAWFVLTPLIIVVIVSLSFVTVAVKHADDTVVDNYYKQGRMINQSLEQDKRAANWELAAHLHWGQGNDKLEVELESPVIPAPSVMTLWLGHPFDETQDVRLTLEPQKSGIYTASLPALKNMWYATLVPGEADSGRTDSPWRLRGEIYFDRRDAINLVPPSSR
ncbi:FixH family protein [Gilvimarinus xylanilyticus]|uniref:FixH family protein n=1 Tax=Gilvimarinus xylanilyticus TaxID=2944139 RepID=A0A9X2KSA0_9GAMM|nr:FixH family protein [Gilvimarinus xylanilyticus]MCP8897882.1 FixH family protein [Gilvimarinus xylanilyticus]